MNIHTVRTILLVAKKAKILYSNESGKLEVLEFDKKSRMFMNSLDLCRDYMIFRKDKILKKKSKLMYEDIFNIEVTK